jgi:hypothetical protein
VGNEFLRLGGELWRDGIRLTRVVPASERLDNL